MFLLFTAVQEERGPRKATKLRKLQQSISTESQIQSEPVVVAHAPLIDREWLNHVYQGPAYKVLHNSVLKIKRVSNSEQVVSKWPPFFMFQLAVHFADYLNFDVLAMEMTMRLTSGGRGLLAIAHDLRSLALDLVEVSLLESALLSDGKHSEVEVI